MDLYDRITNISNTNIEEELEKSIYSVRINLSKLDEERTCKIYSSALLEELKNKHIPAHLISTNDLGFDYEHYFLMIPNQDKFYLSDLTFSQFCAYNEDYSDLLIAGYQEINNDFLNKYLKLVTNQDLDKSFSIDDIFYGNIKRR